MAQPPAEVWLVIISHLDSDDSARARLVCKDADTAYRIDFDKKLKQEVSSIQQVIKDCEVDEEFLFLHRLLMNYNLLEEDNKEYFMHRWSSFQDVLVKHPLLILEGRSYAHSETDVCKMVKAVHRTMIGSKFKKEWLLLAPRICYYRYGICWAKYYQPYRCCHRRKYPIGCGLCKFQHNICYLCDVKIGHTKNGDIRECVTYRNKFFICYDCNYSNPRALIEICPCVHPIFPEDTKKYCMCGVYY